MQLTPPLVSLLDILHMDSKLFLVFEFLDMDLKRYMDKVATDAEGMGPEIVKVRSLQTLVPVSFFLTDSLFAGVEIHLVSRCLTPYHERARALTDASAVK